MVFVLFVCISHFFVVLFSRLFVFLCILPLEGYSHWSMLQVQLGVEQKWHLVTNRWMLFAIFALRDKLNIFLCWL